MGEVIGPVLPPAGSGGGGGSGTVTSVSVVSANGLAGTVANATTTPAITISTSINSPVLAGNGTAISAATATGTGTTVVLSASPALTGTPTAPTASVGTNTTQLATTAFVQAAVVDAPSAYTLSTITADPAPGVVGTYYRANYAASGNFTLPTSPATGSWIKIKQIANNTLSIVGTVDAITTFSITQYDSVELIYNGTTWDAN